MTEKPISERISNTKISLASPLTQEAKDQISTIAYGSVDGEKCKERDDQCMGGKSKVSPKPWQLVAFIFARPIAIVVIVMCVLGVLFATNELFKMTLMSLISK